METSTKYITLAIVLAVGLYCMKIEPMDGALVFAAVVAVCIVFDRIILNKSEDNCSCEYSPDHDSGLYENFDSKASSTTPASSSPSMSDVLKSSSPTALVPVSPLAVPVSGVAAPTTPEMDTMGLKTDGDLGYSQVPLSALKNSSDRITLKPRAVFGEVFVDSEAWHPACIRAPVCVTSAPCLVQPVFTNGSYTDLMEWDTSRKITPPSAMDSDYMTKVLNL